MHMRKVIMLRKVALALSVVFVAGTVVTAPLQAQTLTVLHSFNGGKEGQLPGVHPKSETEKIVTVLERRTYVTRGNGAD